MTGVQTCALPICSLIILPLLYTTYLETTGEVIKFVQYEKDNHLIKKLIPNPIAESSTTTYITHVFQFLKYLNNQNRTGEGYPNVHQSYLVSQSQIREYLNEYQVEKLTDTSLSSHQSAISSYFNFLAYLKLRKPHEVKVSRKARKAAFDNNRKQQIGRAHV